MGVYGEVEERLAAGETVATVTVTDVDGSAPQEPGATMLVRSNGDTSGTIGGGTVEELSREAALEAIEAGDPRTEHWELRPDGNTGMVCGGEMTVFINVHQGTKRLVVAGGGHIAAPLAELGATMGYEVSVVDDRAEFADEERFPDATVHHGDYDEGVREFGVTENTAVAVATRSGTFDRRAAREALAGGAFYVGVVASETKAEHIREQLRENDNGLDDDAVDRVRGPVGLDLGGPDPEDVALSILAEINMVRHGGTGTPLSAE
jgi:xanthine dehydrogenase accessory factor